MADGSAARSNEEVMVGGLVKLSPDAAEKNRRALRRMRGARTLETAIYRETPAGEEIEVQVTVEYSFQGAEADVGIMSGYVEVNGVYLTNEDGSEGPLVQWSQQDGENFDEGEAIDLLEDACDRDDHDAAYDAGCDR